MTNPSQGPPAAHRVAVVLRTERLAILGLLGAVVVVLTGIVIARRGSVRR